MPSFNDILTRRSAIYCFPCSTSAGVTSFSTSSPYADLPATTPKAMAMGSPTIPVPGIPTPMAFFSIFALRKTPAATGLSPSTSAARATQRDTHIGSVHPIAGTTCCFTNRMMRSRSVFSIFIFYSFSGPKVIRLPVLHLHP